MANDGNDKGTLARPFGCVPGQATINMKVPTQATSMNDTPIKKYFTEQLLSGVLASNDPDCCAECFMGNLFVGRVLPNERTTSSRAGCPVVAPHAP